MKIVEDTIRKWIAQVNSFSRIALGARKAVDSVPRGLILVLCALAELHSAAFPCLT